MVGTTTEGHDNADDLTIATSGQTGITIRSASNQAGNIYFSDATSGGGESDGFISYSQSVNKMFFGVNQETRMLIDSSGNVGIGTSTINRGSHSKTLTVSNTGTGARSAVEIEGNTANAHGVLEFYNNGTLVSGLNSRGSDRLQFVTGSSGTVRGQFTSNGLNFGSDNTAATALNEYEEGTWTPAISGVSYSDAQGHYVKIGTTCFITLTLNGANTSKGNTDIRITGLPFTPKVDSGEFYPANSIPLFEVSSVSLASGFNNMYLRIDDAQGNLQILVTDGESHGILTAGGGTTLNSNHALRTSFTYLTAT